MHTFFARAEETKAHWIVPAPEASSVEKSAYAGVQTPIYNRLCVMRQRDLDVQRTMLPFADLDALGITCNISRAISGEAHRVRAPLPRHQPQEASLVSQPEVFSSRREYVSVDLRAPSRAKG